MKTKQFILFCLLFIFGIINVGLASAQISDDWTINPDWSGGDIPEATPTPTTNPVTTINTNIISGLAIFAVLPVVIGAATFMLLLNSSTNTESAGDSVPAIIGAVVAIVLTEICAYIAVYTVNAFPHFLLFFTF